MLQKIRKSRLAKFIALFLSIESALNGFFPTSVFALTGGPSQPEVQSFEPIGTSDMVDLFSGDYNYNIPLLDVGGYPINISYHSGVTMDQEATWVGLGWNINPGVITRNMRGMPDDFNGSDQIEKHFNMKENKTYGANGSLGLEAFGSDKLGINFGVGVNYNNYNGIGIDYSVSLSISSGNSGKGSLNGSLGLKSGSDGLTLSPNVSYSARVEKSEKGDESISASGNIGTSFNSRSGLKNLTIGISASETEHFSDSKRKISGEGSHSTTGYNGGSSINFGTQTYIPQVSMSMVNTAVNVSFKWGGTFFGFDGTANIGGYYSEQRLADKDLSLPAYGYFHAQDGEGQDLALMDFNREKDGAFTQNTPSLPLTIFSYDIYSVAGQGIGGMYRPFRSDLGYVFDSRANSTSDSYSLGVEIAGGNAVHGGVDISVTDVNTTSGKWLADNNATSSFAFKPSNDPLFEPYYMKEAGEKSVDSDPTYFAQVGEFDPVRFDLADAGDMSHRTTGSIIRNNSTLPSPQSKRASRQRRNQVITMLTKDEASSFGIQKNIYSSLPTGAKNHHIAEITTVRPDGSRYIFGLPAYNTLQREVTLAIDPSASPNGGIVTYGSGDNSTGNSKGLDNYFSSTDIPPYAHSYMLTSVLSPDYVDVDGVDGPSKGDLGSYTKFNYASPTPYNWRVPYGSNSANFNEGLKSDPLDNKGSYVYGQKSLYYLRSIETKNYIAVFELGNRKDGFEVAGENGGQGSNTMKFLKSISLYSVPDYTANGNNATPIKVVHFQYDYSLCPNVPNNKTGALDPDAELINQGGKLTLKKVFFTYGNSKKGRLSPYEFHYADLHNDGSVIVNPPYDLKAYDRWGNFKPIPASTDPTNAEFPYVEQDKTNADKYTASWSLTSIDLPSGGKIKISYEADDYAYVQDKPAMQMFKIASINNSANSLGSCNINICDLQNPDSYLFFQLPSSFSSVNPDDVIKKTYLKSILGKQKLYFRFLVNLTKIGLNSVPDYANDLYSNNNGDDFEFISGYADIADAGAFSSGGNGSYDYGWIKLSSVNNDYCTSCVNPISKATWQFGRLNRPKLVFNSPCLATPNCSPTDLVEIIKALVVQHLTNVVQTFTGPNEYLRLHGLGKAVQINKSWIRLDCPNQKKLGGGSRVQKVEIFDNWASMASGGSDFSYGQEYNYETTDRFGNTMSSGVASYEPMLGNDENPLRQPVTFSDDNLLAPDNEHYLETPFGESFFPAPSIGYSKVTVKNLQYNNVNRHATGSVVHEFYTAKDFPVITKRTDLDVRPKKTSPILSLFKVTMKDYMTASQGFSVELNDMHGKPKAQWVYAEDQTTPISGVRYFYKTDPGNSKRLDNTVKTIDETGTVNNNSLIGVDFDCVADFREQQTITESDGLQLNLATFLAGIIPGIVPTIWPSFNQEKTRFRSATITKVINRFGILERTEALDLGSKVSTDNLAYDAQTGEVLLTKTKTDFEDEVYSFTYPAHWGYDRMGQAYQNIGAKFAGVAFSNGVATVTNGSPNGNNIFVAGDELALGSNKRWVCSSSISGNNSVITVIDDQGKIITTNGTFDVKIIRSGRRNQQITPIGTVTSLTDPIATGNIASIKNSLNSILNTSAVEFSENWQMVCGNTTPATVCQCHNNSIAPALQSFLNSLANNNVLITSTYPPSGSNGTLIWDHNNGNYFYNYSSILENQLIPSYPTGNPNFPTSDRVWFGYPFAANSNKLHGEIQWDNNLTWGDAHSLCDIYIDLPSAYSWNNVQGFSNLQFVPPTGNQCPQNITDFTIDATIQIGSATTTVTLTGNSCFSIANCAYVASTTQCGKIPGDVVNPYFTGIRGNWRAKRSYLYLSQRNQTLASNNTDVRKDGTLKTFPITNPGTTDIGFQPFWNYTAGNWMIDPTYWTFTSEVTKFSPFGFEVENKDALNRFSAAIYRYNNSLPIAVASNAKYKEIAYDGFEDYAFFDPISCSNSHFDFRQYPTEITNAESHSGLYSIKVNPASTLTTSRELSATSCPDNTPPGNNCPYTIQYCDCIGHFSPETDRGDITFVLSVWMKETNMTPPVLDYPDGSVSITVGNNPVSPQSIIKSDVIEGWQRYEMTFIVPGGSTGNITVSLSNSSTTNPIYFDDIRIHPFNSNMKAFVYHPVNLRLMAELDENNYATFYEYDEEGALLRVKKETERGIMTIQESRNSTKKQ